MENYHKEIKLHGPAFAKNSAGDVTITGFDYAIDETGGIVSKIETVTTNDEGRLRLEKILHESREQFEQEMKIMNTEIEKHKERRCWNNHKLN